MEAGVEVGAGAGGVAAPSAGGSTRGSINPDTDGDENSNYEETDFDENS